VCLKLRVVVEDLKGTVSGLIKESTRHIRTWEGPISYRFKGKTVLSLESTFFNSLQEKIDIIGYDRVSERQHVDLKAFARNAFNAALGATLGATLGDEAFGQTEDTLVRGKTLGVEPTKARNDFWSRLDVLETEVKELKESTEELRA
jgi:hypothetical protein